MNKFIAIAVAAVLGVSAFATAADPADTKTVNVKVTVQPFAEIKLPNGNNINVTYSSSGSFVSSLNFKVLANANYTVIARPNDWLEVPMTQAETGVLTGNIPFGKVSTSDGKNLGYFMMMRTAAGSYIAGLPYVNAAHDLGTCSVSGTDTDKAATGSLGLTEFQVAAGGSPDRTADRAPAAPGEYTGTASLIVTLN